MPCWISCRKPGWVEYDHMDLKAHRDSWLDEWEVNGVKCGYGDMRDIGLRASEYTRLGIALVKAGIKLIVGAN